MITKYVVFHYDRYAGVEKEVYWRGTLTPRGEPAISKHINEARHYVSARDAYDHAGSMWELQPSGTKGLGTFKVGKRYVDRLH